ncbi:anthranilate synthase component I family protein [Herbiconiux sp. VKM Ac-1786]|uniref:anthranilate synthase component I family protein n=1 Tax=Herbiconiux sp. VKM Ac-1786 TaxID=2783824 RepID=UPI00188ABABD|nr:anthranilate synthase component I family protein [Herbiconiux sp. VKM Ac-1786]MBF4573238.1 anthranilate synthase component I family protein [Herbiconiux sp. VKM Ac-1786]
MAPRLLRHRVAGVTTLDPAAVFRALHDDPSSDAFWLDDAHGWSVIGTGPRWRIDGPLLPALAAREEEWRHDPFTVDNGWDAPPFRPGLVGWLGYEVARETMGVPDARPTRHPDAAFLEVDRAVALGPVVEGARRVELLAAASSWTGELGSWRQRTLDALRSLTEDPPRIPPAPSVRPTVRWRDTRPEYLAAVRDCQAAITRGDAYVLNLSTEIEVTAASATGFDPLDVYDRLRAISPAPHGGVMRIGGVTLLSSSPERFVRISGGTVTTHPVKGTRRRSTDARDDAALRADLAGSVKERAENVMIVDLMRNDLARVSVPGGVEVTSLLAVETHPRVHQLVSAIAARLRPGAGVTEVLEAAFPAGSMTGAPKRSAVQILDGLEQRARGLYSGAFGWIGRDGSADLAMTIRSIVLDAPAPAPALASRPLRPTRATIGVGGGITALSIPEEEYDEVLLKAAALLEALGAD